MPKTKVTAIEIQRILQMQGVASTEELLQRFAIGRTTLSRLVSQAGLPILRIGKTNNTRYALERPLPGIGATLPLFQISESGRLHGFGKFINLYNSHYFVSPPEYTYSGLPPAIADMQPQGFMGRAFAHQYATELGVPTRLDDWTTDHILLAIARRGEDMPGNLILGTESAERWKNNRPAIVSHDQYPALVRASLSGQPGGSAAGGDQPKFDAFIEGEHFMVKFAGTDDSPGQKRWKDLLICEETALSLLAEKKIASAQAKIHVQDSIVFLEVKRFDRIGARGRKAVLTLAAIDHFLFGAGESWSALAEKLLRDRHITSEDSEKLKLLDAFGAWIADSDRHNHNILFFPDSVNPGTRYALAPAFDKLPMLFTPVSGQTVERSFGAPVPNAFQMEVWSEARKLGLEFWSRVAEDGRISKEFRQIARNCVNVVKAS
jgi:hypothetical protein